MNVKIKNMGSLTFGKIHWKMKLLLGINKTESRTKCGI